LSLNENLPRDTDTSSETLPYSAATYKQLSAWTSCKYGHQHVIFLFLVVPVDISHDSLYFPCRAVLFETDTIYIYSLHVIVLGGNTGHNSVQCPTTLHSASSAKFLNLLHDVSLCDPFLSPLNSRQSTRNLASSLLSMHSLNSLKPLLK
jgi:hypothetical protein